MVARFFVDENDLALGKALAALHGDVVCPGHPGLPEVPRQTEDDVWLEVVGRRQLVVITRDKRAPLCQEVGSGRAYEDVCGVCRARDQLAPRC